MSKSPLDILKNNKNNNNLFSFLDLINSDQFSEIIFEIPVFQRNYVWKQEQIQIFLDDVKTEFIEKFIDKTSNDFPITISHDKKIVAQNKNNIGKLVFFGIIYWAKSNENKKEIIDGHQRIFTWFLIILACFRIINYHYIDNKFNIVDYPCKKELEEFYHSMRNWLFINFKKNSFRNDKISLHFDNLRLKDKQLIDEKIFKELFNVIFFNSKDEINFIPIQKLKNFKKNIENKNTNIFKAYVQIEEFILDCINETKEKADKIERSDHNNHFLNVAFSDSFLESYHLSFITIAWLLFKTFDKFQFAVFELSSFTESSQIFETINGKGVQLTAFDIIKNKLYIYFNSNFSSKSSDNSSNEISEKFTSKISNIENMITETYKKKSNYELFLIDFLKVKFLHFFDTKKLIKVNLKNLHKNFLKISDDYCKTNNSSNFEFANHFLSEAEKYLLKYKEIFITNKFTEKRRLYYIIIKSLNLLDLQSVKIILMCMLLKNDENKSWLDFEDDIFKYIERLYKYYLLNLTIEGKRFGSFNIHFLKIIFAILEYGLNEFFNFSKNINSETNKIFSDKRLKSLVDFNLEMINYFKKINEKKTIDKIIKHRYQDNSVIKWYLYNIAVNLMNDNNPILETLSLEHVLPIKHEEWEKNDDFWKNKHKNDFLEYKYKLGNCLLLWAPANSKIQNKLFFEKWNSLKNENEILDSLEKDKILFGDYSFLTTGENQKSWDILLIDERNNIISKKLSEYNIFNFK